MMIRGSVQQKQVEQQQRKREKSSAKQPHSETVVCRQKEQKLTIVLCTSSSRGFCILYFGMLSTDLLLVATPITRHRPRGRSDSEKRFQIKRSRSCFRVLWLRPTQFERSIDVKTSPPSNYQNMHSSSKCPIRVEIKEWRYIQRRSFCSCGGSVTIGEPLFEQFQVVACPQGTTFFCPDGRRSPFSCLAPPLAWLGRRKRQQISPLHFDSH